MTAQKAVKKSAKLETGKYNPLQPKRVAQILAILQRTYPDVRCALHHENAWQLLVATILSAQCTMCVSTWLLRRYSSTIQLLHRSPRLSPRQLSR